MSLVLAEIVPSSDVPDLDVTEVLRTVESVAGQAGGEFIEAQVTGSKDRVFAIVEGVAPADLRTALGAAGLTVDDVANAVLFLCGPASDLIQGQTLIVDGGAGLRL